MYYTMDVSSYNDDIYSCVSLTQESELLEYLYSDEIHIRRDTFLKNDEDVSDYIKGLEKFFNDLDTTRDIHIKNSESGTYDTVSETTIRKVLNDIISQCTIKPQYGHLLYYYIDDAVYVDVNV